MTLCREICAVREGRAPALSVQPPCLSSVVSGGARYVVRGRAGRFFRGGAFPSEAGEWDGRKSADLLYVFRLPCARTVWQIADGRGGISPFWIYRRRGFFVRGQAQALFRGRGLVAMRNAFRQREKFSLRWAGLCKELFRRKRAQGVSRSAFLVFLRFYEAPPRQRGRGDCFFTSLPQGRAPCLSIRDRAGSRPIPYRSRVFSRTADCAESRFP